MKTVLLLKQVPESGSVTMDETTGTVLRRTSEAVINPLDLYAIEAVLRIRDKTGGECIALSMGPPSAESVLREAISMGVDRGFLVSDRAFAGSDTWATARILSAAIEKICPDFDLIVCGERAIDGDTGQIGPETAAALNIPVITYVNQIEGFTSFNRYRGSGKGILDLIRFADADQERISVQFPALITVVKEIADPRLPTLDGKIKARRTEISVLTNIDLALPENEIGLKGSPTRVLRIFHPKLLRKCVMTSAENEENLENSVDKLCAFLKDRNL